MSTVRRCPAAAAALRDGTVAQRVHGNEANITDAVAAVVGDKDVAGLQIHIEVTGAAALGQGSAQVDTQIHSPQVGQGAVLKIPVQRPLIGAEQIHVAAGAVIHGNVLAFFVGKKSFQFG